MFIKDQLWEQMSRPHRVLYFWKYLHFVGPDLLPIMFLDHFHFFDDVYQRYCDNESRQMTRPLGAWSPFFSHQSLEGYFTQSQPLITLAAIEWIHGDLLILFRKYIEIPIIEEESYEKNVVMYVQIGEPEHIAGMCILFHFLFSTFIELSVLKINIQCYLPIHVFWDQEFPVNWKS